MDSKVNYPLLNDRYARHAQPKDQLTGGSLEPQIDMTKQTSSVRNFAEREAPKASRRHGSSSNARPVTGLRDEPLRKDPSFREEAPLSSSSGRVSSQGLSSVQESGLTSNTEIHDAPHFAKLDGDQKTYASIPHNDIEQRAAYLANRPSLVKSRLDGLLREAVQQILQRDVTGACMCVQSLVELNLCRDVKPEFFAEDLIEMHQGGAELNSKYNKHYRSAMREAEKTAKAKAQAYAAQERRLLNQDQGYSKPLPAAKTLHARHDSKTGYTSYETPDMEKLRADENSATTGRNSESLLENISSSQVVPVRTENSILKIKPEQFADDGMKKLSAQYQVPRNGAKFFVTGKVFALLWHEPAGAPRNSAGGAAAIERDNADEEDQLPLSKIKLSPNMTIGPYGEKIYSHIRRMVVIKNRDGYCWCIGINSYSGQGLKKSGLKKREREAHTIIHDCEVPAQSLPNEIKPPKRPIAVKMVTGQSLTRASRLHYGKPYVVEWYTRVMDIGQVLKEDMPILLAEAAAELLGDTSKPQQSVRHEYV